MSKKSFYIKKKKKSIPTGLIEDSNMAAVSLFGETNTANVTSCNNKHRAVLLYVNVNWDRPTHRWLRALLFTNSVNLLYVQGLCMWDGFTVYRRYPRRLESLTVCRCHYKGRPSSTVMSRAWILVRSGSELAPLRSEAWHISNWTNQATVFFFSASLKIN